MSNSNTNKQVTRHFPIHGQRERDLLSQAINKLQADFSPDSAVYEDAQRIKDRLPGHDEFQVPEDTGASDSWLADASESEFKQVTDRSWMGVRESGRVKVIRRFKFDSSDRRLYITTSYHFGTKKVEEYNSSRPVENVLDHIKNPEWHGEINGLQVSEYCKSVHEGSTQKDERRIERLIDEKPNLKHHLRNSDSHE